MKIYFPLPSEIKNRIKFLCFFKNLCLIYSFFQRGVSGKFPILWESISNNAQPKDVLWIEPRTEKSNVFSIETRVNSEWPRRKVLSTSFSDSTCRRQRRKIFKNERAYCRPLHGHRERGAEVSKKRERGAEREWQGCDGRKDFNWKPEEGNDGGSVAWPKLEIGWGEPWGEGAGERLEGWKG